MKMKRIIAGLLSFILLMGNPLPAFATESDGGAFAPSVVADIVSENEIDMDAIGVVSANSVDMDHTVSENKADTEDVSVNDIEFGRKTILPEVNFSVSMGNSDISSEYVEIVEEAKADLQKYLDEKGIFAIVYMADTYAVKETADADSKTVTTVPSARTVQILGMEVNWDYQEEWEEYIPTVWYETQFYEGEQLYSGYIEESYLAYSDELLLQWKNDWFMLFPMSNAMYAASDSYSDVEKFPTSYRSKLRKLKDAHPNWTFVPMNVNRNWKECVKEQLGNYSWIYHDQPSEYRGSQINSKWYYATEKGIAYYMDPRNFLTESNIFQFEQNTYNASYHTQSALQSFLNGTFMKGKVPGDPSNRTYAQVIYQSGKSRGLSPFNLAARVIQEQGVNGTSPMISGTYPGYEGLYNHYNIKASGKSNEEVYRNGLSHARTKGWTTRTKSLEGGAEFIGNGYILQGQDTLYLQKFDIEHGNSSLHQYMQNIMAPYTEGRSMKSMYDDAGSLNSTFVFKIPVFNNMPNEYKFTLNKTSLSLQRGVENKETYILKVYCNGEKAESGTVTFKTDNSNVATVSSTGVIKAVGGGTTTIHALVKYEDMKVEEDLKCKVTVAVPLQDISLNITEQELYLEEGLPDKVPYLKEDGTTGYKYASMGELPTQVTLEVSYDPVDTTDSRTVKWTVADESIVSIEPQELTAEDSVSRALVTAKNSGTTTVTAKVGNFTKTAEITVRVPMLEARLNQNELMTESNKLTLHKGESTQVTVSYAPHNITDRIEPIWSIDKNADQSVVIIEDGMIVAKKTGNTTLHAAIGQFDGSQSELTLQVTVEEYKVTFMNADSTSALVTASGEYGKSLGNLVVSSSTELPWSMEKDGAHFMGWYTGENGSGDVVTENTILYSDMTIYPYFVEKADEQARFYVKPIGSVTYTGAYLKPEVKVYAVKEVDGESQFVQLTKGIDYTVSYFNNKLVNDGSDPAKLPTVMVTGAGQYVDAQSIETTFAIVPKNISHIDVIAKNLSVDYTGKVQKLRPTVTDAGRTLQRNVDYTLEYTDTEKGAYLEAGTYTVKVTGKGNYTGTRYVYITITKRVMLEDVFVSVVSEVKFNNGEEYVSKAEQAGWQPAECRPKVTVKYNGKELTEEIDENDEVKGDYKLEYINNTEIGTASIKITGLGAYIGTRIISFKITGTDMRTVTVSGITNAEYTGEAVSQSNYVVKNKSGVVLKENIDYKVSYRNNTDPGKGSVVLIGINGYTGSITKTFAINAYDISKNILTYQNSEDEDGKTRLAFESEFASNDIEGSDADFTIEYEKGGAKPAVKVYFKGHKLTEGIDYTVSYENNDEVTMISGDKKPTVVITGKGRFTGKVVKTFTIVQKDISEIDTIEVKDVKFRNRKGFCFVEPILTDTSGQRLKEGVDYILKYTYVYDTVLYSDDKSAQVIKLAGSEVHEDDIPEKLAESDQAKNAGATRPYIKVTATGMGNYDEETEISATYKILENTSLFEQIISNLTGSKKDDGSEEKEEESFNAVTPTANAVVFSLRQNSVQLNTLAAGQSAGVEFHVENAQILPEKTLVTCENSSAADYFETKIDNQTLYIQVAAEKEDRITAGEYSFRIKPVVLSGGEEISLEEQYVTVNVSKTDSKQENTAVNNPKTQEDVVNTVDTITDQKEEFAENTKPAENSQTTEKSILSTDESVKDSIEEESIAVISNTVSDKGINGGTVALISAIVSVGLLSAAGIHIYKKRAVDNYYFDEEDEIDL